MNIWAQIFAYALVGVFSQNVIFTVGVGAERALRLPISSRRVLRTTGAVTVFSFISVSAMHLIRLGCAHVPALNRFRVPLLVLCVAIAYLIVMIICRVCSARAFKVAAEVLPSGAFNTVVVMVGISSQMLGLSFAQSVGYAIGTGVGFLLATVLIHEAILSVDNADMSPAFVGLPSLLIYIGILAMAFIGVTGGPRLFL